MLFAKKLVRYMDRLGTDDSSLIRTLVSQRERHLASVNSTFSKMHAVSLEDWIKAECSGAYKTALLRIVQVAEARRQVPGTPAEVDNEEAKSTGA